jgi:DNA-damage-inducible protein D
MNKELLQKMQRQFDALVHKEPGSDEIEFWFARELQEPLGYARWENFMTAIQRAIESCQTTGFEPEDHFRGVTKMVSIGSGAERLIDDFMLTRYACYLIAQNGDPRKEPIALEDIKKLERRVKTDEKKLGKKSGRLPKKDAEP